MKPKRNDWSVVFVIAYYTVREALRNRILWIALVFSVMGVGLAAFIGDVALVEHRAVEVVLLASAYRYCAALALMVLVISTLVREFNDKCLELYLSMTISRGIYFTGKLCGFFAVGGLLAAVFGGVLLLYADAVPAAFWALSLMCELAIVAAVAVFCVMSFNQQIPASFAACLVFYLMCRAADGIVLISKSEIILHTFGAAAMQFIVKTLVFVLPSLGRFARSEWLAYGGGDYGMGLVALQTAVYVGLIGAAAMIDFSRK
ncbi:MAG: ABC transporter permease, partial [Betaproteobacteria bacterium]|nr:ABC transporter permease [Betaproteobacteria bacterium]